MQCTVCASCNDMQCTVCASCNDMQCTVCALCNDMQCTVCDICTVIYVLYVRNSYILPRCAAADVKCFICCTTLYPDVVIDRQFILQICA